MTLINRLNYLLNNELTELFTYSGYVSYEICGLQIFFSHSVGFFFSIGIVWSTKDFNFHEAKSIYVFFCQLYFLSL